MPVDRRISRRYRRAVSVSGKRAAPEDESLHGAAAAGRLEKVRCLLERGANANIRDARGATALHHAVRGRHLSVIELLLDYGADLGLTDRSGVTALELVIQAYYEVYGQANRG